MIITDPSKAPRLRLADIVKEYFFEAGFDYKKSQLEFTKTEKIRKITVRLFFLKTINLVSGSLAWGILFPELERFWKKVALDDQKNGYSMTLYVDLSNYFPLRNTGIPCSIDMYNEKTQTYDDFSLNSAGEWIIANYEKHIVPYFEYYNKLSNLEKEMNAHPLGQHPELMYGGRQIAFGLVLRKKFIPDKFDQLVNQYYEYIVTDREDGDFKKTMLIYLERTTEFLKANDIKTILPD